VKSVPPVVKAQFNKAKSRLIKMNKAFRVYFFYYSRRWPGWTKAGFVQIRIKPPNETK